MSIHYQNIRALLSLHNNVSPEKVFLTVVTPQGREELKYGEFSARSHQTSNYLQEDLRIQPGDTVALLDDFPADMTVLLMSCWIIGAVAVPLPASPGDVVARQLVESAARIALIRSRYLPDWQFYSRDEPTNDMHKLWQGLQIIQLGGEAVADYQHFNTLVRGMPNTFFNEHPEPTYDAAGALFPLSINPVLWPISQGQLLSTAQSLANRQTITGNQRIISYLPLSGQILPHVSAADSVNIFLTALLVGGSIMINTVFEPQAFWHEIAAGRLHIACLSGEQIQQLITFAEQQRAAGKPIYGEGIYQQDIRRLRHIYCPSADVTDDVLHTFAATFPLPVLT